jgi:tetratricopeptide (TPR) repeat protein
MAVALLAVSNSKIRHEQAQTRDAMNLADRERRIAEQRARELRQSLERLKAANTSLERGRWAAAIHHWDAADVAFSDAVELRPDHAAAWVERGDQFAWLGLWDLASADFARDFELRDPDETMRWYRHALLLLYLDDLEGYRRVRDRMWERFQGTVELSFATELVRTCVLADDSADRERLVEVAGQAVAHWRPARWYELYVLGIAQYRAGNFEQAVLRLRESLSAGPEMPVRAISYPVLAMAHHRLGESVEAREALRSAAEAAEQFTTELYENPGGSWVIHQDAGPAWPIAWWDWLEFRLYCREAQLMIDGAPPPDDPRTHILRARALAGLRRNFAADIEYAVALQHGMDNPQICVEARRSAGYSAVGRREWQAAAAEFAKACELAPDDSYLWRYRAIACLAAGDFDGYRQASSAMLERFRNTDDPETAGNVLLVCVLRDDALPDMAALLPLTMIADSIWHWGEWARGAALYRAGRYEESVECFEAAANIYRPRAWDWSFLAMAHHRLGHDDDARRCQTEAARWIDAANRQTERNSRSTEPAWGNWHEPIVDPLLLQEAEELLMETPAGFIGADESTWEEVIRP